MLYLTVLGCCLVFYTAYGEWLSWLILMGVLWLPVLSLAVSLPAMLCFRAEPAAPEQVEMGTEAEVWLVGQDRLPVPPFKGRLSLHRMTTGEQWRRKGGGDLPTDHCGGIQAQPCRVWVYDYLGLIGIPVWKKQSRIFTVRPKVVTMSAPPELERYLARAWRPKPGGGYSENHELRLYRPGDSLNQVHWKLTAKTGKLILREPMEPLRGRMVLTMNLRGDPEALDRKFGRLLWLGAYLLEHGIQFEVRVLTAEGIQIRFVTDTAALYEWVDKLLCCTCVGEGDIRHREFGASWQYHIGGDADEA